ncbi:MAG: type II secretion system protein [Deltaproteobacteria bacterium]|nr:type II secretion system protein [Deltaproteobacteria bacterium]
MRSQVADFRSQILQLKTQNSELQTQRGFTLLEVVVAMAIVGLGVVTLLEIFSSGLRLGSRSSVRSEAVAYSRQVMDEALSSRSGREGVQEGSFAEKYRWKLRVGPVRDESKLPSPDLWELREIVFEMEYRDGDRERKIELKTLRLVKRNTR